MKKYLSKHELAKRIAYAEWEDDPINRHFAFQASEINSRIQELESHTLQQLLKRYREVNK